MGDYPALAAQIDNDAVIPYYSRLAKTFTFCDRHFGLGTNSTPGHMLAVGGQTPTLKNPPFGPGGPIWDLPSIFMHAQANGIAWTAFLDTDDHPLKFYKELSTPSAKKQIHTQTGDFISMAKAGKLPQLVYAWAPSGFDEHPPQRPDPQYIARGQQLVQERVDAVVQGGGWANTVFILTWDDWGGYADHVAVPCLETVPDALHPNGFQVLGGSRMPLIMFGGAVEQGIDNTWHSHASIPKTVIDLFGLPAIGIARVDQAPSIAHRVGTTSARPSPPALGAPIVQPPPPTPTPHPVPPPPGRGRLFSSGPSLLPTVARRSQSPPMALCIRSRRRRRQLRMCPDSS